MRRIRLRLVPATLSWVSVWGSSRTPVRLIAAVGVLLSALLAAPAAAHTSAGGFTLSGSSDNWDVTFWYGTYHIIDFTEGDLRLTGPGGYDVTLAFDQATNTPPTGLVENENYYEIGYSLGFAGVESWQGVSFSGLADGDYVVDFIPISTPSYSWFQADYGNGTVDDVVSSNFALVPEPSTALLLGVGLAGLGMCRRQRHPR